MKMAKRVCLLLYCTDKIGTGRLSSFDQGLLVVRLIRRATHKRHTYANPRTHTPTPFCSFLSFYCALHSAPFDHKAPSLCDQEMGVEQDRREAAIARQEAEVRIRLNSICLFSPHDP